MSLERLFQRNTVISKILIYNIIVFTQMNFKMERLSKGYFNFNTHDVILVLHVIYGTQQTV